MESEEQQEHVFVPVDKSKVFKDPIHGDIVLHPVLVAVIDTPQFQRLRRIRQTGPLEFVYPGAVHTRFQHCIGTSHLAGLFIRKLRENDPTLLIDIRDELSVQVAALLHDLGHGPYSHLFDGRFLPRFAAALGRRVHHEELSIKMFDYLLAENEHVRSAFEQYGLNERDVVFIKELIDPKGKAKADGKAENECEWPFEGRDRDKAFLYEIVSNSLTGVDVDKFDYLARDAFHLGMHRTFDHLRYITFCKVVRDEHGTPHIVARDKEAVNLYDMYQQRYRLHLTAYQHKTGLVIQEMFTQALVEANDFLLIPSLERDANGQRKLLKMSECVNDMSAYTQLTDDVFAAIRLSVDPRLDKAKRILDDINCRRIFACVGKTRLKKLQEIKFDDCAKIKSAIVEQFDKAVAELKAEMEQLAIEAETDRQKEELQSQLESLKAVQRFTKSDFIVCATMMNYGINSERNPLEKMRFYSKFNPAAAFEIRREQISVILPAAFSERLLYAYANSERRGLFERDLAARCFRLWCKSTPNDYEVDEAREGYVQLLTTPVKPVVSGSKCSVSKKQKLDF